MRKVGFIIYPAGHGSLMDLEPHHLFAEWPGRLPIYRPCPSPPEQNPVPTPVISNVSTLRLSS
jgi:hypothetical protein